MPLAITSTSCMLRCHIDAPVGSRAGNRRKDQLGDCKGSIKVEGGKGAVEPRPDGTMHLVWNPKVRIEEVDAQAAIAAVNTPADGAEYPMLVNMTATPSLSRQARTVFSLACAASRIALLGPQPGGPDPGQLVH
jgi:hypothetical protein